MTRDAAVSALPSGDHIASEGHDRTLTTKEGQRYHSTSYGPWEPIFPDQTCAGCGMASLLGLPCDRQEGLW